MIPEAHPVFAESRLVYRMIELESTLKEQQALYKRIVSCNNYIASKVLKIERKQRKIGKHLGKLTTFTIRKYKNLETRLEERERAIENITLKLRNLNINC